MNYPGFWSFILPASSLADFLWWNYDYNFQPAASI